MNVEQRIKFLADRADGIGASDAPAVMGVSPWKSPLGLYAEKTGAVERSLEEKEFQEWGHRLEDPISRKFQDNHPELEVVHLTDPETGESPTVRHPDNPRVFSHPDRLLRVLETGQMGLLQIKTTNVFNRDAWETGTPTDIRVQVQHELMTAGPDLGADFGYVAVLIGGQQYKEFQEEPHAALHAAMMARHGEFLAALDSRTPPDAMAHRAEMDTLKALFPDGDGTAVDLTDHHLALTERFLELAAAAKDIKNQRDGIKAEIAQFLGNDSYGILPGAAGKWTWNVRAGHHRKAVDIAESRILSAPRKLKTV